MMGSKWLIYKYRLLECRLTSLSQPPLLLQLFALVDSLPAAGFRLDDVLITRIGRAGCERWEIRNIQNLRPHSADALLWCAAACTQQDFP